MTDREAWQRVRALFDELADSDAGARARRLAEISRDDPALGAAVERLLHADAGAESALRGYQFGASVLPVDGASPGAMLDPLGLVGHTLSHFEVTAFIAAGGMGAVYAATDTRLGRRVALKFPLLHDVDGTTRERFLQEARAAATLDHPTLCTVHEVGDSDRGVFLAMPLYDGETLRHRLARDGRLPTAEAIDLLHRLCAGLAYAHAAGVIHRDLKPANVMLLRDGGVKVLDFGLAKLRDASLTASGATLGTIGYVAPEQVRGEAVDARADLWALGVMLHEMVTGTSPFAGSHDVAVLHAVLHEEPPPPSARNASLPPDIDRLVGALLQKDPADRLPTVDALRQELEALREGRALRFQPPFWTRTRRRRQVRRALPMLAAGVAVLSLLGWLSTRAGVTAGNGAAEEPTVAWRGDTATVATTGELLAALVPANAGRHVHVLRGTYDLAAPLVIPDRMTVSGAGVMQYDTAGLPTRFADSTRTVWRMTANTAGAVVTLGDHSALRGIEITDLPGRSGNVVAVLSRTAGDSVRATVEEVVLVNPNPLGVGPEGPFGRALVVLARNPNMGRPPAAHEGSTLALRVAHSVVQSPEGGGGYFAYNFAARSRIALTLVRNVIDGGNEANGGVSRPDAVSGSSVEITSDSNWYRNPRGEPCAAPVMGWNLTGGSGPPLPITTPATTHNRLAVASRGDRIEGFTSGIFATASRRFFPEPVGAPPADNHLELQLTGTRIATPSCAAPGRTRNTSGAPVMAFEAVSDIRLIGGQVENDVFAAGARNTLRATLRDVTGSGPRANLFVDAGTDRGELRPSLRGGGNRVEIVGDAATFRRTNHGLVPMPAEGLFTGTPSPPVMPREPVSSRPPR